MRSKIPYGIKRKAIQIAAFGFTNSKLGNFINGRIYKGKWKQFCVPSLNCYSCPAATFSCPIGAIQAVGGSIKFSFSFYVIGFLLAVGVIFGRAVCGFLCPFGLLQELLYKIPTKKFKLPRRMKYIKYAVLLLLVIILPAVITDYAGSGKPFFCEFICPQGTLEGGIPLLLTHKELRHTAGSITAIKFTVLGMVLIGCVFVERCFCKVLCPLGAIYGLLNKISFLHIRLDKSLCVSCGKCADVCPMDVDPASKECERSAECILCGKCVNVCPKEALSMGFKEIKTKK